MLPVTLVEPAAEVVGEVPVAVREVVSVVPAPDAVVVVGLAKVVAGLVEVVVAPAVPETHW